MNKSFEPVRTPFDWLSRDAAEVDKYLADPLCGFPPQVQAYLDVVRGLAEISRPARQTRIPQQLPIYIFYGSRDPVAVNIKQLLAAYRQAGAGLTQVTYKEYLDARHETLNEINRDEVTCRDLIAWLDGVVECASHTASVQSLTPGTDLVRATFSAAPRAFWPFSGTTIGEFTVCDFRLIELFGIF